MLTILYTCSALCLTSSKICSGNTTCWFPLIRLAKKMMLSVSPYTKRAHWIFQQLCIGANQRVYKESSIDPWVREKNYLLYSLLSRVKILVIIVIIYTYFRLCHKNTKFIFKKMQNIASLKNFVFKYFVPLFLTKKAISRPKIAQENVVF